MHDRQETLSPENKDGPLKTLTTTETESEDQKDPAMSALERPPREIPPQKFLKNKFIETNQRNVQSRNFLNIIVRLFWEQCTHSPENAMVRPIPICE